MTIKISDALANELLDNGSFKTLFETGSSFIYIFSGTVPATAGEALDVPTTHTLLAKIAADVTPADSGVVGLDFAAAAGSRALTKSGSQTWAGKVVASGTATFFRLCSDGDNGQGAASASNYRVQGSCGTSGADFIMTSTALVDNDSNTVGMSTFEVRFDA